MKLTVLVDNNTYIDQYYFGEPALCFYMEDGDKTILLDTGYSDIFIKNAASLGKNLADVDYIVFSHGHDDHTKGIKYLEKKDVPKAKVIAHPDCILPKYVGDLYVGSPYTPAQLDEKFGLVLAEKPMQLSENIWYLGHIPRVTDFEIASIGQKEKNGVKTDDYLDDDTALVYKSKDGLFIITGCSHSGICNICEYAKKVCGEEKICGIIGGFHLFEDDEKLKKTVDYFVKNKIEKLYPCHCVSLKAKHRMMEKLDVNEVGVGLVLEIE